MRVAYKAWKHKDLGDERPQQFKDALAFISVDHKACVVQLEPDDFVEIP